MEKRVYNGFRSATQRNIANISEKALRVRAQGITKLKQELEAADKGGEYIKNLIAAMNVGVSQAQKELRGRKRAA